MEDGGWMMVILLLTATDNWTHSNIKSNVFNSPSVRPDPRPRALGASASPDSFTRSLWCRGLIQRRQNDLVVGYD